MAGTGVVSIQPELKLVRYDQSRDDFMTLDLSPAVGFSTGVADLRLCPEALGAAHEAAGFLPGGCRC